MTIVRKVDQLDPDRKILREAARVIREGGTVVFPTETVYGLGANAFSGSACMKIFEAKKRPADNPLIVHIRSIDQLYECTVEQNKEVVKSLKTLWPGPLTILMKRGKKIPDIVTAGLDSVAVRMPANPLALKLIEASGVPVAAPSANLATKPSIVDSSEAIEELDGRVDMILDAGPTFFGIESTILNTMSVPVRLMRPGAFAREDLEPFFGKIEVGGEAKGLVESDVPLAPGMKYRHYSPENRIFLLGSLVLLRNLPRDALAGKIKLIASDETIRETGVEGISLGARTDLYEVARNLYPSFRELDRIGAGIGLIEPFPEYGIGLAIMNRIRKASSGAISNPREFEDLLKS